MTTSLVKALAALAIAGAAFMAPTPAGAEEPIKGNAYCIDNGNWDVSWTATSWRQDPGLVWSIDIVAGSIPVYVQYTWTTHHSAAEFQVQQVVNAQWSDAVTDVRVGSVQAPACNGVPPVPTPPTIPVCTGICGPVVVYPPPPPTTTTTTTVPETTTTTTVPETTTTTTTTTTVVAPPPPPPEVDLPSTGGGTNPTTVILVGALIATILGALAIQGAAIQYRKDPK